MSPDVLMRAVAETLLLGGRGPFGHEDACRDVARAVAAAAAAHGPVPTPAAVERHLGRVDRDRRIRRLRREGVAAAALAARFHLSTKQIGRIVDAGTAPRVHARRVPSPE